jgi:hypothetical protein
VRALSVAAWLALGAAACTGEAIGGGAESNRGADGSSNANRPAGGDAGSDATAFAGPLRVAVISDLNGSYGSADYDAEVHGAVARIVALKPDLVISTGDMVAGQRAGLNYGAMLAGFHAAVSDPLANAGIPFAVTPGNHDASGYAEFGGERFVFAGEWNARRPAVTFVDDANYPFRYAFTIKGALFVSLDDTTVGPLADEQMAWLDGVLGANAGATAKIVFGHVPLYPLAAEKASEVIGDRALEDLLNAHGVTAFITGHHHAYFPGRRDALRLVSMACLGSGARKLMGVDTVSPKSFAYLELGASGIDVLDAFKAGDFLTAVDRNTLPAWVGTGDQTIVRDDL